MVPPTDATYVGSEMCAACHEDITTAFANKSSRQQSIWNEVREELRVPVTVRAPHIPKREVRIWLLVSSGWVHHKRRRHVGDVLSRDERNALAGKRAWTEGVGVHHVSFDSQREIESVAAEDNAGRWAMRHMSSRCKSTDPANFPSSNPGRINVLQWLSQSAWHHNSQDDYGDIRKRSMLYVPYGKERALPMGASARERKLYKLSLASRIESRKIADWKQALHLPELPFWYPSSGTLYDGSSVHKHRTENSPARVPIVIWPFTVPIIHLVGHSSVGADDNSEIKFMKFSWILILLLLVLPLYAQESQTQEPRDSRKKRRHTEIHGHNVAVWLTDIIEDSSKAEEYGQLPRDLWSTASTQNFQEGWPISKPERWAGPAEQCSLRIRLRNERKVRFANRLF